jgi:hypothetical protein
LDDRQRKGGETMREIITPKEMQLGDTVRRVEGGEGMGICFCDMMVRQIKDGMITFFRPFVHTSDFSTTSGVFCYVGVETFSVYQKSDTQYFLMDRQKIR